jgi:hypothetical protein
VGIEVDAEVRMVTIKEIGFEVGVNSFGKSWTLKEADLIVKACF